MMNMNGLIKNAGRWPVLWKQEVYKVVLFPVFLMSWLPQSLLRATIGRCCYFVVYSFLRYRYHVVVQNLARAFPEKPYSEINKLAKGFYRHFCNGIVEIIKSLSAGRHKLAGRIHISNTELLEYYQRKSRPMVALLGHYGNWESLNVLPSKLTMPVNALYKPLTNKSVGYFVTRIRSRFGMQLIPAGRAIRQLMREKGRASLNLFIADQFPGYNRGFSMELLNQRTSLFDGAEKLAKAVDAVVFYIELQKNGESGWNVHFSLITDKPKDTRPGEITRCFGERLQQTIRKQPEYWLWSHRRWK